jgi:hypothetical protein
MKVWLALACTLALVWVSAAEHVHAGTPGPDECLLCQFHKMGAAPGAIPLLLAIVLALTGWHAAGEPGGTGVWFPTSVSPRAPPSR